ncbi:hypothetical protein FQN60_006962 [Etheostoma spectabile]|uniref:Uncharacterized protein n=1 Tax=Etheostoma spectabile TaxID=54343 RepID=A0A5J5CHC2_9PERO|nr:hypothetical protein FQN60_006962 [Etheostoma spectabile]
MLTSYRIVPPCEGSERHSIQSAVPVPVARKLHSIARSQVEGKRQMSAREKKVTKTIFAIRCFLIT